jgi:hypothetical protein
MQSAAEFIKGICRSSAHESRAGMPLLYTQFSGLKMYNMYEAEMAAKGEESVSQRTFFRVLAEIPELRPEPFKTCLCKYCEDGKLIVKNITAQVVAMGSPAVKQVWDALAKKITEYMAAMRQLALENAEAPAKLSTADFRAVVQSAPDGPAKAAIITQLVGLDNYIDHLHGWGYQFGRYKVQVEQLQPGEGVYVVDYKMKMSAEYKLRTTQEDFFKGQPISYFCLALTYRARDAAPDSPLITHFYDLLSPDSLQDSLWLRSAFAQLAEELRPLGLMSLKGWSDNGSGFHAGAFLTSILPEFMANVGALWFEHNFFQPGEAKSICDRHFAVAGAQVKRFLRYNGAITGVEELKKVIEAISHTSIQIIGIQRETHISYKEIKGITQYKQFIYNHYSRDGVVAVREYSDSGHPKFLALPSLKDKTSGRTQEQRDEQRPAVARKRLANAQAAAAAAQAEVQRAQWATAAAQRAQLQTLAAYVQQTQGMWQMAEAEGTGEAHGGC